MNQTPLWEQIRTMCDAYDHLVAYKKGAEAALHYHQEVISMLQTRIFELEERLNHAEEERDELRTWILEKGQEQ